MNDPHAGIGPPADDAVSHGHTAEEIEEFANGVKEQVEKFFEGCDGCIVHFYEVEMITRMLTVTNQNGLFVAGHLINSAKRVASQFGKAPEGATLN